MRSPGASEEARPPVVGILGGICSGKTTVARMLAEEGFELIDADGIGHQVLARTDVKRRLREEFGPEIFDAEGQVDRAALARRIFGDTARTEKLNSIVHPPILEEIGRRVRSSSRPVVLDAALLMEKGLHLKWCDLLVFVDTPREERLRRAREERNWEEGELQRRENAQISSERKRRQADHIIGNSGSKDELKRKVKTLSSKIRETLAQRHKTAGDQR